MGVLFKENNKVLEFDIIGYEFPDTQLEIESDDYDANWVTVSIKYSDGTVSFAEKDNCLLSFEFKELIDSITDIITGKETGLIQTFMEPYFSFAVTQIGEEYAVQIRFVYDTSDNWKTVYVCQKMMLDELTGLRDAFKALYDQYPYRKVKEE